MLRSWVASETQRIARLCFKKQDFDKYINLFKERLLKRSYPLDIINFEIAKVDHSTIQHGLLHEEVNIADCALCQTATQVLVPGTVGASEHPYPKLSHKSKKSKLSSLVKTRITILPMLPNLTRDAKHTKDLIHASLAKLEAIGGLERSSSLLAWKGIGNLSTVFSRAASKATKKVIQLKK